jgi:uncharacterized membrane protein YedE/YeeE
MDLSPVHKVALMGFCLAMVFGAVASKTNFCTMGAVSDWVNMGNKSRLRAWFMAIGIAIIVTQGMQYFGVIDLSEVMYLNQSFGWMGHLVGGTLFGIGMTLGSGCGQRTLVRVGGGNLKSLVVLLVLGLSAYATMRGLLALVRVKIFEPTNISLADAGISDQGVGSIASSMLGIADAAVVSRALALVLGLGLVAYALASPAFRRSVDDMMAGLVIGLLIPAGWYVTGVVGFDDFEPVRIESFTFVAPSGESLQYLMTFTGSTISFGVAAVAGVIAGAFLYTVLTGKFRVEAFTDRGDMIAHLWGGVLMGFGGVLALGCTIGQGVTGMSTLALGSAISLLSIIFGSALTMKVIYYRLDDMSFLGALRQSLLDFRPRSGKPRAQ